MLTVDFTNTPTSAFVNFERVYSTAEIENGLFFGDMFKPVVPDASVENAIVLVVHGDMYQLEPTTPPVPATPLTEESGLFHLLPQNPAD
jgi:hypothetical protein